MGTDQSRREEWEQIGRDIEAKIRAEAAKVFRRALEKLRPLIEAVS